MPPVAQKNKINVVISEVYLDRRTAPLKAKYFLHKSFNNGQCRQRTGNSHGPTPKRSGHFVSRQRAYGPW